VNGLLLLIAEEYVMLIKKIFPFLLLPALATSLAFAATNIACVGNSITAGYGLAYQEDYPTQWQNLLGTTDYTVFNFGVSGKTMLKTGNESYWSEGAFTNARASSPNVVVIELGTNDSKPYHWYAYPDEFLEDYKSMIDTFEILSSKPKVWICLAPYSNNAGWNILDTSITLRINPDILQVGLDKGVNIIDLHSTFTNTSWYASDSVHPNAAGAVALAGIINGYFQRDTLKATQNGNVLSAPPGYAFQWYLDGDPIEGATNNTLTISTLGTYKVSVKVDADNNSRLVTQALTVTDINPPTAIKERIFSMNINVSDEKLHITLAKSMTIQADIFDMQGRLLKSFMWQGFKGTNTFIIPTGNLQQILRVTTDKTSQFLFVPVRK